MESQRKYLFIDTSFTRIAPSLEQQQRETKWPSSLWNLRKKIEISTFTGDPKRKALTKVQIKVGLLEKHFSLFIFHLWIKNIFWCGNIAKLENRKKSVFWTSRCSSGFAAISELPTSAWLWYGRSHMVILRSPPPWIFFKYFDDFNLIV